MKVFNANLYTANNHTLNDLNNNVNDDYNLITIFGTGDYGTALGKRLIRFGYRIVYGSRNPDFKYIQENFSNEIDTNNIKINSVEDAWLNSKKIIFFAVHANVYEKLIDQLFHAENLSKKIDENHAFNYSREQYKIVIDVSNRLLNLANIDGGNKKVFISNAEYLQHCFNKYTNKIIVVKAFNNLSAYSMDCEYANRGRNSLNSFGSGELVPVASDNQLAKDNIVYLCNQIGFRGFQIGSLDKARDLEKINEKVFPEWKYPTIFSICFLIFNFIWYFFYSYFTNVKYKSFHQYLNEFALLAHTNRVFAFTSINLLAYVYLAGIVASMYQLYYGTKKRRFPIYLDLWLKSRKQLGLWAFFFATLHMIMTFCVLTPSYFSPWYQQTKPVYNRTVTPLFSVRDAFKFTLHAEINLLTGIIAYVVMALLALCSINSISSSLNWPEWTFIQSKCGIFCLTCSLIHDLVMFLRFVIEKDLHKYTTKHIFTRVKFLIIWLPLCVLILKFLFTCFPPISNRILNIRSGIVNKTIYQEKRFRFNKIKSNKTEATNFIIKI